MQKRPIGVEEKLPLLETIPLSLQHLFAMFGSTVLVPILFKINPATVLLFNGIGTILYLVLCKGKNPGIPRFELCLPIAGFPRARAVQL